MRGAKETAHRLAAYSDAVFAVIGTVMVLKLTAPKQVTFSLSSLYGRRPSPAICSSPFLNQPSLPYAFVRYSRARTNMDQLRPSLHDIATALCDGMDCTHPAGVSPVVFYAGLFVCIDIAYNVFERDVLSQANATQVSERTRHRARLRSLVVLAIFTTAMLILHLRPVVPSGRMKAQ